MCLIINREIHPTLEPLVAKYNIIVYKCLSCDYNYRNNKYEYYTRYRRFPIKFGSFGVFSYPETELIREESCIFEGIHSYTDSINIFTYNYAIIPTGAKFFVGRNNDIVSTKLIVFNSYTHFERFLKNKNETYNVRFSDGIDFLKEANDLCV